MTVTTYREPVEALDEAERELNVRARCFPRWVTEGKMSRTDARDRLDRLASVFKLLEKLLAADGGDTVADVICAYEALRDNPQDEGNGK